MHKIAVAVDHDHRGAERHPKPLLIFVPHEGQARRLDPVVLEWVPNDQIHWRVKTMGGLVSSVHFLELEQLDTASTIFSNGELIGGLMGPTHARQIGRRLYRGFEAMNEALKARAEAAWRAQGGAPTSGS